MMLLRKLTLLALVVFFGPIGSIVSAQSPSGHNIFVRVHNRAHAPRVLHTQTLLSNGRVLLAGGFSTLSGLLPLGNKDLEIFDPRTNIFNVVTVMPTIRAMHTATVLPDGRVLFIGGAASTVVEVFDPRTNTVSPVGNILNARAEHAATLLSDGRILITGGIRAHLSYRNGAFQLKLNLVRETELFDPKTGKSEILHTRNPIARRGHTQTLLGNGTVLIAGGDRSGNCLLLDPKTRVVRRVVRLTTSREDHTATLLPNGEVLIIGGSRRGKSLATAEVYDPVQERFFRRESTMSIVREDHTATLLADGRVLVTGGEDNQAGPKKKDVVLRGADVFDPNLKRFTRLMDLNSARDDHRATLLKDGRVFIFGGLNERDEVLDSGEFFVP